MSEPRESPPEASDALRFAIKKELRDRMRRVRRALPDEARAARAAKIWERVFATPQWQSARTVMLFVSMRTEIDTAAGVAEARAAGRRVVAPRMTPSGLEVREWEPGVEPVESGRMVREPPADAPLVDPREVDFVLVPALALDPRGARIGYGAALYDGLLPRMPQAYRVGVAFDFQLLAEIPETPGDQRVHLVVTDTRTVDTAAAGSTD